MREYPIILKYFNIYTRIFKAKYTLSPNYRKTFFTSYYLYAFFDRHDGR